MLVNTKAIVLTSIKYGDSDLIVNCLTEMGVKSYMLKGVLKSKSRKVKVAYFQPLNQLELTAFHNKKGNLNRIREVRPSYFYATVSTDIYKQAIAFFLAETLASALREEESNQKLFTFIETSFQWLDQEEKTANFHLVFLLQLTRFLGFYPDTRHIKASYFDLQEGYFTERKSLGPTISAEKLILFKSLIGIKFDDMLRLKWSSDNRMVLLQVLLDYYELHLPGFKKPKSLKVLKEVFNEIS